MSEEFQQTVNLRKKMKEQVQSKRAEEIDHIFEDEKQSLRKINKPEKSKVDKTVFKQAIWMIIFVVVLSSLYLFFKDDGQKKNLVENEKKSWYAVELDNGETYFGQIEDETANPLVLENVYYDYDQVNGEKSETGNIRLVKRGNEAHGPSGTMLIYQAQIGRPIEILSDSSKVLQAILNHEK